MESKLLITLFELYRSDFGHFQVVFMKSVGQLACLPIFVSANTPSPSKEVGPVNTETDLKFRETSLRSDIMKKNFWKKIFQVLTAISCPLKLLNRFAHCFLGSI